MQDYGRITVCVFSRRHKKRALRPEDSLGKYKQM